MPRYSQKYIETKKRQEEDLSRFIQQHPDISSNGDELLEKYLTTKEYYEYKRRQMEQGFYND